MLIDRYTRPANIFVPSVSDPILLEMDWILDDPYLFALVRRDMAKHYKASRKGRHPVPVEVTLRMTILRRRKKWTYRQAEDEVRNNERYRWWVRVYDQSVPDYSTLNDLERAVQPKTLHCMNDRIILLAQEYRLTQGYRLRLDPSVIESNIHYPTDSSLLTDGVRVLSRWLKRARPLLPPTLDLATLCRRHTCSARRRAIQIARLSRPGKGARRQTGRAQVKKSAVNQAYAELIGITRTTVAQARQVVAALQGSTDQRAQRLVQQFTQFIPLVEQAIEQTVRRVLNGEMVSAPSKIVSLFEPHTQIICRGKAPPHATEFGHKVNYAEVEGGFVVDWKVIAQGNPKDETLLAPALHHHVQVFGHAPDVLAGDRGLFSPANEDLARALGVKEIALPQRGRRTAERQAHEKQKWFKKGQRFRNGIEGRISVVRRTVQLSRCPNRGLDGLERWVGWGMVVANLVVMARGLHKRRRRPRSGTT